MARIKIMDLPKDMKISGNKLSTIRGGSALDALLSIVDEQAAVLHQDTARLWEDSFIEPGDPWTVPYIGEPMATKKTSRIRRRY